MSFNRARSLPPSDFTDPKFAALPALVRMTAAGLRMFADDEGRGLVRLRSMIAEIYEYDLSVTEHVMEDHLLQLDDAGWLTLYQADGMSLFQIRYWPPVPHMRPSDLPAPPGYRMPQRGQHDTLDESYERQEPQQEQQELRQVPQEQLVGNPYTFPPQQPSPWQEPAAQQLPPTSAMLHPGESSAVSFSQAEQQVSNSYALVSPGAQEQLQMIHQAQASQPSSAETWASPPQNISPSTSDELSQKTAEYQAPESFMKPSRSVQEAFTAVARESARAGAGAGARAREGVREGVGARVGTTSPGLDGENLDAAAGLRGQVYPNPGAATPPQQTPPQQVSPQARQQVTPPPPPQAAAYVDPTIQAAEALPCPPSPFCSQHQPWGTEEACGPCRTTRMAMDIYNEAKARVGLSTPAAPPAPPAPAPPAASPPPPPVPQQSAPNLQAPQQPSGVRFVPAEPSSQAETDATDWGDF
ncbi:hypothetical protein [Leucobacter sp. OH1287]|uniref:hypothetical protein n=1 Tax=Leucobacter sp. OH1287 TaxID=2491049 RepID=UPI000F5E30FC|nr:hypothetical protein [Leucobacter sp. OH1287]RRD61359.1 hypothetical protein EII30_02880 [Leucobacter sp. OH1287]